MSSVKTQTPARDEWFGIEIRHLLAFDAIARGRSFSGAADELGYVQSAVSHQLAYLERLVGTRLVERERGPRPISLTRAGELLLEHTRDLLAGFAEARNDLDALADGRIGALRVAVLSDTAPSLVGALLERLRARLSNLELSLWEWADDDAVLERLGAGTVDIALTELPLADARFHTVAIRAEPYVLVVAAGSPAAGDPLAAIERAPLVAAGSDRAVARIRSRLRLHGLDPVTQMRAERASTARSLAAGGLGVAILPAFAVDGADGELAVHELPDVLPVRLTGLVWRAAREHDPLIAVAREEGQRLLG